MTMGCLSEEDIDEKFTNLRNPFEECPNVDALYRALRFVGIRPVWPRTASEGEDRSRFVVELLDGEYRFVGKKEMRMILSLVKNQTFCTETVIAAIEYGNTEVGIMGV